jgi:hypothetical protein
MQCGNSLSGQNPELARNSCFRRVPNQNWPETTVYAEFQTRTGQKQLFMPSFKSELDGNNCFWPVLIWNSPTPRPGIDFRPAHPIKKARSHRAGLFTLALAARAAYLRFTGAFLAGAFLAGAFFTGALPAVGRPSGVFCNSAMVGAGPYFTSAELGSPVR